MNRPTSCGSGFPQLRCLIGVLSLVGCAESGRLKWAGLLPQCCKGQFCVFYGYCWSFRFALASVSWTWTKEHRSALQVSTWLVQKHRFVWKISLVLLCNNQVKIMHFKYSFGLIVTFLMSHRYITGNQTNFCSHFAAVITLIPMSLLIKVFFENSVHAEHSHSSHH